MNEIQEAAAANNAIVTMIRLAKTAGFDLPTTRTAMGKRVRAAWEGKEEEASCLFAVCGMLRRIGFSEEEARDTIENAIDNYWQQI